MLLIGDIGGTKTRLALFEKNRTSFLEKKFPAAIIQVSREIFREFLSSSALKGVKIEKSCFGVAGPVVNRRCKATNLPWMIDGPHIGIGTENPPCRRH